MGKRAPDHSSRAWWMSEWHTPQNWMSTTTSRALGSRRSMVIGAIGLPAAAAPHARIVCMLALPPGEGLLHQLAPLPRPRARSRVERAHPVGQGLDALVVAARGAARVAALQP